MDLVPKRKTGFFSLSNAPDLVKKPVLTNAQQNAMTNYENPILRSSSTQKRRKRQTSPLPIRKEYRKMTDAERTKFHNAVRLAQTTLAERSTISQYELLASFHRGGISPGAHTGSAFLAFHRYYLFFFESLLRNIARDPTIAIPYWDSTLEETLMYPCQSILFSDLFAGSGFGPVETGPFANFKSEDGSVITRSCNPRNGTPLSESDLEIFDTMNPETASSCNDKTLEDVHSSAHVFIGGTMSVLRTAAYEPLFWLHHANIDRVFDKMLKKIPYDQRENSYPKSYCMPGALDKYDAIMFPFNLKQNKAGFWNVFNDKLFAYEARPTCQSGCDGPYLYCNPILQRCVAKYRKGAFCTQSLVDLFENYNVNGCYDSTCQLDVDNRLKCS